MISTMNLDSACNTALPMPDDSGKASKDLLSRVRISEMDSQMPSISRHASHLVSDQQAGSGASASAHASSMRRHVHFSDCDSDGTDDSPVVTVRTYSSIPKDMYPVCFWSFTEIRRNAELQREKANHFNIISRNMLASAVLVLHGFALTREYQDDRLHLSENDAVKMLVESNSRGLEIFMTDRIDAHRRCGINTLIVLQSKSHGKDPEDTSALLRLASIQMSVRSTRFAFLVAKGDEAFVKNQHRTDMGHTNDELP